MVKYVPCSKLIFHVDNGLGNHLKGTGLAAEYDVIHKTVIWRKISTQKIKNQQYLSNQLLFLSSIIPSTLFITIVFFIKILSGDVDRVYISGLSGYGLPVILGFIMFISFEYLMLRIRSQYERCSPPSINDQILYFESVDYTALKFNDIWSSNKIPYLTNIVISLLVIGIVLPITFWLYLMPSSFGEFGVKLILLGLIISLIPNIGWNLILKSLLLSKIKKALRRKEV